MSEEKNLKIKDTLRSTKERHSHMSCVWMSNEA